MVSGFVAEAVAAMACRRNKVVPVSAVLLSGTDGELVEVGLPL